MHKKFKHIMYYLITIFLALGLSISFQSLLAAWSNPDSAPPGGTYSEPLNKGSLAQNKLGPLGVNYDNISATGLSVKGNVGIGTTTPQAMMHLVNSGNVAGVRVQGASHTVEMSTDGAGGILDTLTNGYLVFGTNYAERMRITSSGNVGIGTTSPRVKLEINSALTGAPSTSGTTQTYGALRIKGADDGVLDVGSYGSGKYWVQATNQTNLATNYDLLLQPNGANVGIGTTNASTKLSVSGAVVKAGGVFANGTVTCTGGITFTSTTFTCASPMVILPMGTSNAYHILSSAGTQQAVCLACGSISSSAATSAVTSSPSGSTLTLGSTYNWEGASSGSTYLTSVTCTP